MAQNQSTAARERRREQAGRREGGGLAQHWHPPPLRVERVMKGRALVTWQLSRSKNGNPPVTAKSAVAMARWADRGFSLVLLVALASAALADGDQLASVQLISTPEQLATLITQPLVSLVNW